MTGWDLPTVSCIAARCSALAAAGGYQFTDPRASDRPEADLRPGSQFQLALQQNSAQACHPGLVGGRSIDGTISQAAIKEKADSQLSALPVGSRLVYSDGGADGNGANGQHGACGFGVVVTEKQADWTPECQPTVLDCYFGPVVCDSADPFWLGANRGTNNTGELNGISTAILHLQREGGHQPAAICYDSKYAANVTDGTWDAKTNV
eukprot:COSAG01_NODE_14982_length_1388_cov_15.876649_3_plen_206_part_01